MKFDRGFVKWAPFNAVIPNKLVINNINEEQINSKPTFFPEKLEIISDKIKDAYYSQNKVKIKIYEHNKIIELDGVITHIYPENGTIKFNNEKIISFNQFIDII